MIGLATIVSAFGGSLGHFRQHLAYLEREWSQSQNALLCFVQSRAGDHLHGTRDLLRRLDAGNPGADGF